MVGGQTFEHIDRGRNGFPLPYFTGFGQIQFVEEDVAQLLGRIDIELSSRRVVNLFAFGIDFVLQA